MDLWLLFKVNTEIKEGLKEYKILVECMDGSTPLKLDFLTYLTWLWMQRQLVNVEVETHGTLTSGDSVSTR